MALLALARAQRPLPPVALVLEVERRAHVLPAAVAVDARVFAERAAVAFEAVEPAPLGYLFFYFYFLATHEKK